MRRFVQLAGTCLLLAAMVVGIRAMLPRLLSVTVPGLGDIPGLSQLFQGDEASRGEGRGQDAAEPPAVAESEHGLWYEQLSDDQKRVYDWFLAYLPLREQTITIEGASADEAAPAYLAVIGDHPEFFWLTGAYTYRQPQDGSYIEITPEFSASASEVAELEGRIRDVADQVLAQIPSGASDYDRARICYEWVIDSTSYQTSAHDQTIQGVFLDRVAVCAGYARSFQYLMRAMGMRCAYLSGGGHAWNLVWIDGTPTYVDTTWGDPVFMAENGERAPETMVYDYLCLTADELYRNHAVSGPVSDPQDLPACDSTAYDYYRLNGLFFEEFSAQGLADAIDEAAWRGERSVRVKYGSPAAYGQALEYLRQDVFSVQALSDVSSIYHGGDEVLYIVSIDW